MMRTKAAVTAHKEFKNITGGIAMIGGIFETIGKTLGGGKEKYFLELDDAAESGAKNLKKTAAKAAKVAVEATKEASADVVEKAKDVAGDIQDGAAQAAVEKAKGAAKKAADTVVDAAKDATASKDGAVTAKAAKAKAAKKAVAKTKAAGNLADGAAPEAGKSVKAAAPAAPAGVSAEDLITAAIAASSSGKSIDSQGNIVEAVQTFSTDYLMTPSRSSRRRPGPSLSAFKGMAKEVNPRLRG